MSVEPIRVEGNLRQFSRFEWTRAAGKWAAEAGPLLLAELRAEAPVGTGQTSGKLRDGLRWQKRTRLGKLMMIFDAPDVPYLRYVIDGTSGGQTIAPVAARALHWNNGGGDVFAMSVTRGSTPANDFPSRVWDRMRGEVHHRFTEIIKKELM